MTESEGIEKSSSSSRIEIKIARQENSLDDEVGKLLFRSAMLFIY